MAPALFYLVLFCAVAPHHINAHPMDWFRKYSATARTEHGWLWGWGADSTVSVVDRSPPVTFLSRPAAFGSDLVDPLLGYVIPLSSFTIPCPVEDDRPQSNFSLPLPNLGCPKLCVAGPNEPESNEPWIAIVQRGECQFVDKAREAQRLGAKAVVVGGDDPDISGNPDTLVNMYSPGDSSDVLIASTFIKYSDYLQLMSLIATSNTSHSGLKTLSLLISTEYSAWEWYSPILTFIIILLLPSTLTFITLLIHRVRAARAAQRDRAPETVVHNLPWRVWTGTGWEKHEGSSPPPPPSSPLPAEGVDDIDLESGLLSPSEDPSSSHATLPPPPPDQPWFEAQQECAICLSEFAKGDRVRVLPCNHIFHMDEVDEWLIHRKKLCPVCKADVTHPHPLPTHKPHPGCPHYPETRAHPEPTECPDTPPPAADAQIDERTPLLSDRNSSQDL
ncbi:hypothetical protein JAAARDRAFT_30544 [Jaapia argillacea MUCL 33604]|uniref:RING-type E3 ubiquitin transferase n=1 Tax=Jaapia argillacea MUCL 33604 TaxID=933084 RepID=A0A067Q8W9_9AGAM|nr:hypothetical protein JAAARDRAFT_30544 [Jaapia argillacea MUCL 33604]